MHGRVFELLLKYADGSDCTHQWNIDKYGKYEERHDSQPPPPPPSHFIKDARFGFLKYPKKGIGSTDFSHNKEGVGKISGLFKKKWGWGWGEGVTYFHANSFQCYRFPNVCCVCVCVCVCVWLVYSHHFYQYHLCFTEKSYIYSI